MRMNKVVAIVALLAVLSFAACAVFDGTDSSAVNTGGEVKGYIVKDETCINMDDLVYRQVGSLWVATLTFDSSVTSKNVNILIAEQNKENIPVDNHTTTVNIGSQLAFGKYTVLTTDYMSGSFVASCYFEVGMYYTVTFAAGEGSGTMDPVETTSPYELPECDFVAPAGYEFDKWLVGETLYDVGDPITLTGDETVTATYRLAVPVEAVELNKTELTLILSGGEEASETLVATVLPDGVYDKTVTWSIKDVSPAGSITVDENGKVTATAVGTATVVATSNADKTKFAECSVSAVDEVIHVTGVTLDVTKLFLYTGEGGMLTPTVLPSNASDKSVTWSTSDASIATVDNGNISTFKEGTAYITVTTNDGGFTAKCTVKVSDYKVTIISADEDEGTVDVSLVSLPMGGSFTVNGNTLVFSDTTVVTASPVTTDPAYIYSFDKWTVDDVQLTGEILVTSDMVVVANFNAVEHLYTVQGSVAADDMIDPYAILITDTDSYKADWDGNVFTFTDVPYCKYASIMLGAHNYQETVLKIDTSNPKGIDDVELDKVMYALTLEKMEGVTYVVNDVEYVSFEDSFEIDTVVPVSVIIAEGYEFFSWSDGYEETDRDFVMDQDHKAFVIVSYAEREVDDPVNGTEISGDKIAFDAFAEVEKTKGSKVDKSKWVTVDFDKRKAVVEYEIDLISIAFPDEPFQGELEISIFVGASYNGKTLLVYHLRDDGVIELCNNGDTTVINGYVKVTVDSLSPFLITADSSMPIPDDDDDEDTPLPGGLSKNILYIAGILIIVLALAGLLVVIKRN